MWVIMITPQSKEVLIVNFGLVDAKKVDMPHIDNLIIHLYIAKYMLKSVFIDQVVNVSILYKACLIEMGLLPSMLNPPNSSLYSSDNTLSSELGTLRFPIKIGNKDEGYV